MEAGGGRRRAGVESEGDLVVGLGFAVVGLGFAVGPVVDVEGEPVILATPGSPVTTPRLGSSKRREKLLLS